MKEKDVSVSCPISCECAVAVGSIMERQNNLYRPLTFRGKTKFALSMNVNNNTDNKETVSHLFLFTHVLQQQQLTSSGTKINTDGSFCL